MLILSKYISCKFIIFSFKRKKAYQQKRNYHIALSTLRAVLIVCSHNNIRPTLYICLFHVKLII